MSDPSENPVQTPFQNEFQDEPAEGAHTGDGVEHGGDTSAAASTDPSSNAACSVPFFIGLVIMAAIILGVTIGLTLPTNNNPSSASTNPSPTAPGSPTAPSPTSTPQAPVASTPMTRVTYLTAKASEVSGADQVMLQDSYASKALEWLTSTDPMALGLQSSDQDIHQRYIAASIYFATQGEYWEARRRLDNGRNLQTNTLFGFLSGDTVCNWHVGDTGIFCDENGKIQRIIMCKSNV